MDARRGRSGLSPTTTSFFRLIRTPYLQQIGARSPFLTMALVEGAPSPAPLRR
jgi:hypothetical protein